ncbi:retrovirus-related pol polyprotein from transposon TNT 1-94 [Tanacetum coccineum]
MLIWNIKVPIKALNYRVDRYKEEVKDLKEMQNVENSFSGSNDQYAEIIYNKRFVRQSDLYSEHAYWKATSVPALDPSHSSTTIKVEVPKELPKVSMVYTSLKELKRYLTGFDLVVKERTTATAITEGTWGFEHTKACFRDEIIPFIKELKDIFNNFNQYWLKNLSMSKSLLSNGTVLSTTIAWSPELFGVKLNKCLELKTELLNKKDFVDKETYDKLSSGIPHYRIQQTPSSNSKNKVEAHPRNVKSSLNKRNGTVKVNGSARAEFKKHEKFQYIVCINGDDCMSSDNLCVSNSMNDVKFHAKSKKRKSKKEIWKPTGKVFNKMGYIWRPTGRTYPIVENACPIKLGLPLRLGHNLFSVGQSMIPILSCFSSTPLASFAISKTLREYYEKVGISHETSVARSPQQNGVVERRNRTLIEAARTMLIYAKAPLFLWAEAVATACYTQNRSMIRRRHGKTPYELLHDKPPDLSYLHVFGALCYPTNDSENLGKLQPKADIGIFIGYAPTKKAF